MSAKRHHSATRRRPPRQVDHPATARDEQLAGIDDAMVRAPEVEPELYIKIVRLSDVMAKPAPEDRKEEP